MLSVASWSNSWGSMTHRHAQVKGRPLGSAVGDQLGHASLTSLLRSAKRSFRLEPFSHIELALAQLLVQRKVVQDQNGLVSIP